MTQVLSPRVVPTPVVAAPRARVPFWLCASVLVALVAIVYLPALRAGFIWDDDEYVVNNPVLQQPGALGQAWFTLTATTQYYPMVFTTFWVERQLWGVDPAGYHAVNVAIHAGTSVLLLAILRRLGLRWAMLGAAIFAVHPVHAESVVWVTERKNTLSAMFYMSSLLCYLRFAGVGVELGPAHRRGPRWDLYGWSLVFFVLALLSKTVTCSLPAAILLITWWKRGRIGMRDVAMVLPMFAVGLLGAFTTSWVERHHVGTVDLDLGLTPVNRVLIAGRAVWFYLGKLVFPSRLSFIYTKWTIDPRAWWQFIYPAAAAAVVLGLWLGRRRIGRGPLVAVLFFVGTLTPALGFVDVYPMAFSWVADHFQYLASLGPIVTLAGIAGTVAARYPGPQGAAPRWLLGGSAAVVGGLGVLTARQTLVYRDLETLWNDTLRKNPACALALNNLGVLRVAAGQTEEGARYYERAIKADPRFALAYNNLASLRLEQGDAARAEEIIRPALKFDRRSPRTMLVAARIVRAQGRHEEAAGLFIRAVELQPGQQILRIAAARELMKAGTPADAIAQVEAALERPADLARGIDGVQGAHATLGGALAMLGRYDEAMSRLDEALRMKPDDPFALYYAAVVRAAQGRTGEAIERARAAIRGGGREADTYALLGLLLARDPAKLDEAKGCFAQALDLDNANRQAHMALGRLALAAGRNDEAAGHFTAVLRQSPHDAEAKAAMDEVLAKPPG